MDVCMTHGLWMEAGEAGYSDMWTSLLLREKPPPHQLALRETAWLYPLFLIPHLLQGEEESGHPWEKGTIEKAQEQAGGIHEAETWDMAGGRE